MKRTTLFVFFFFVFAILEELCYGMDHTGQNTNSNRSSSVDRRSSSPSISSQRIDQNHQQPKSFNHTLAINPQRPLIQPDSLEATSRQQMAINRPLTTNQIQINQKTSQNQTDNLVQINSSPPVLTETHESYQKIVMTNSKSESGSSSATPILIPSEAIDAIIVENEQMQKLKRPMANEEPLEDNAHAKGKQKLEHSWEEALQNEETENLKFKKAYLNNMWTFVMTMFNILDIQLMPIDQTLLHIQHDGTFAKSKKLTLAIKQLNPDEILDSICTKVVENVMNKNVSLMQIIDTINLQATMIFGQLIFRTTKNEPEKSFKCERIKDESEKIENKRLKVSYFYLRLLRKLAGLLEAPYNGNVSKNNTNVAQSMRKCFLSWIRTAMEQFIEEFKAVVNGPNITEQQKKIIGMRNLDKFEVANEVLNMLIFSLIQTLSPLFEEQKHHFNLQSPFTFVLEQISKKNITCLLMARKEPVDFMEIARKSAYVASRYGVAATFLPLLFDSIEPHKDDENSHFTIIKNANVYLKLCKSLLKELENPVFSEIIKVNSNQRSKWILIKNFLSQSVEQFNQLINQWKKEKDYINFENESENGFVSDYLLANCIQFILNSTNQR